MPEVDWSFLKKIVEVAAATTELSFPNLSNSSPFLQAIMRCYREGRLTVVLGAGVSRPFGVPAWQELVKRMYVDWAKVSDPAIRAVLGAKFDSSQPDPIKAARLLRTLLPPNELLNATRDALYRDLCQGPASTALGEVAKMARDGGLRQVITHNYDALLERELQARGVSYRSVYRGHQLRGDGFKVCHVHGFLPISGAPDPNQRLVLCERSYHQLYTSQDWRNRVQLEAFSTGCCLFIGASLTDPNLRRLLDKTHVEGGPRNFIIRALPEEQESLSDLIDACGASGVDVRWLKNTPVADLPADLRLEGKQLYWHSNVLDGRDDHTFGLGTVWVPGYDAIPAVLRSIASAHPASISN